MFQVRQYNSAGRSAGYYISFLCAIIVLFGSSARSDAQNLNQTPIKVYGTVKDVKGFPVMGARIQIQESTRNAVTDEDGNFEIEVPGINSVINVEADGFIPQPVTVTNSLVDIVLNYAPEGQSAKDKLYMPWSVTDKRSATGSYSTITQDELRKSPVMSLSSAVSGRLPGFTVVQNSGAPGNESYDWRIRGIRTLEGGGMNNMGKGGWGEPISIVDGFERAFTDFDASEIEQFTILKDAAATALYGIRAANGVIFITTKRGQENKRTIDLEISSGLVTPDRLPEFMNSYNYASLYNEARVNDGLSPLYTQTDLDLYKDGSSPLTHPDVDYYEEFIKPVALQNKAALTLSGGNRIVRYFVSLAYNRQGGLYDRTDEGTDFVTKSNYARYNTRTNLDVTLSKRLVANLSIAGRIEERKYPYETESEIFSVLSRYPNGAEPLSFNGIDPALNKEIFMLGGSALYTSNVLGMMSHRGYNDDTRRYYQLGIGFKHDLDFITKGLSARFDFNADGYNYYVVSRYKQYLVWDRQVQPDNSVTYTPFNTETLLTTAYSSEVLSYNGFNLNLNYDRKFGLHDVKGLLMWRRFTTVYQQANQPDKKTEDFALRATYSYNNKYFLEGTAVLTGSENFFLTEQSRFLLPAFSASWIVSDEKFLSGIKSVSFLKLRGSWGITANDEYTYTDVNGYKYRFAYRDRWWSYAEDHAFGTSVTRVPYVVKEGVVPNQSIRPEKASMLNFGIDSRFFNNHLSMSAELWFEKRYDGFSRGLGSIPLAFGVRESNLPIENKGIVFSRGIELSVGWSGSAGDFNYWIKGNVDNSQSKIDYMAEPYKEDAYRVETGGRVRQDFGLIALGLFKNQDDINTSPVQLFGPYQPGDIKYKDMNNDNVIDALDYSAIGYGTFPTLSYSMDMGMKYRNFDFSLLLQGNAHRSVYLSNNAVRAFADNGKISDYAENRYTDEASWANADYPRLTTIANDNNWRISTFWLKDVAYLRLKNLEIGYNLPLNASRKLGMYGLRIYINAYNLFTFDNLKDFDPEDPSSGVSGYPMVKITNLGLNLKF